MEPHPQISVLFLVTVTMKRMSSRNSRWEGNAVSPGQINFAVRPDQINFAVRRGEGRFIFSFFFFFFFSLVTRNEENITLNCPKSVGRSEVN